MNVEVLKIVGATLLSVLLFSVVAITLVINKYQIQPKTIKLPFMDFDTTKFSDLSAVKLFSSVSRAVIKPSTAAQDWLTQTQDISPLILVHVGWQIVSGAFIERFLIFPNQENIISKISEVGSQNADFVIAFEKYTELR